MSTTSRRRIKTRDIAPLGTTQCGSRDNEKKGPSSLLCLYVPHLVLVSRNLNSIFLSGVLHRLFNKFLSHKPSCDSTVLRSEMSLLANPVFTDVQQKKYS